MISRSRHSSEVVATWKGRIITFLKLFAKFLSSPFVIETVDSSTDLWDRLGGWLRAEYEKRLNSKMWRAHLYMGIGLTMFIILLILPFPLPSVMQGLLLAVGIFVFHECVGQRSRDLLDYLHSRYNIKSFRLFSSSIFTARFVVFLDLLIAVPMFGHSEYSQAVLLFVGVLGLYWGLVKMSLWIVKMMVKGLSYCSRKLIVIGAGILFISLVFVFANQSDVALLIESVSNSASSNAVNPQLELSLPLLLATIIVYGAALAISYVFLSLLAIFLFVFLVFAIPYFLLYDPKLLIVILGDMPFTLRLWAVVSILVIYLIVSVPTFLSWVDTVRNLTKEDIHLSDKFMR